MHRFILLSLLLLLPWDASARRGRKAAPATPPVPTMEERQAAFGNINEAMMSGRMTHAADMLVMLLSQPEQAHFHAEAYARLGKVFSTLELPYSALMAYEQGLRSDIAVVGSEVPKALALGFMADPPMRPSS